MENKKQVGYSSSSSFTNDLFGAKDSLPTAPSNGVFSSIFAAPSTVVARNHSTSKMTGNEHKLQTGSQSLNTGGQGDTIKDKESESNFSSSKETNSAFQERPEPCPLSSSLYYGGQEDMYIRSSSPRTSGSYHNYKRDGDGGVDEASGNNSNDASRGNWWQGSLYY